MGPHPQLTSWACRQWQCKWQVIPFWSKAFCLYAHLFTWSSSEIDWNTGIAGKSCIIEPNPSPIWPVPVCYCALRGNLFVNRGFLYSLIDQPCSTNTPTQMSYKRTNKRIDANKISQILTKLCFLFRWVIFNWISSSLHFPAHPLKQHHLPQSGSFVISQSAKGNSVPENFVPQELSGYSAFSWWGWTQAILGGDVCQAGQGGLDGSHFSSWSTECLPSSMSCQLTLVSPPSKLTVFVCWLRAFFWSACIWVLIWKQLVGDWPVSNNFGAYGGR